MNLVEEAKKCTSCLEWHKYCNAECCKQITIKQSPFCLRIKDKYVSVVKNLSMNDRWYYSLHGVKIVHGRLLFEKKYCKPKGEYILYFKPCELLDENNMCKGHPDKKPDICKYLTEQTAKNVKKGVTLTKNCLFKYKLMEGDDDGEEHKKSN